MPLLWLGTITFVGGAALAWFAAGAPATRRLGTGIASLGLGTLTMTQPGLPWTLASIACSCIAIAIIGSFVWRMLRKR